MASKNPDPNELMELERELYRRYRAGDIDGLMEGLVENARVCPPGTESIVGRENQRLVFKELATTDGFELFWEPIEAHVSPSDEMGWVYGMVRWKMPDSAEVEGKYISIWERDQGEWKNVVEIRNANS